MSMPVGTAPWPRSVHETGHSGVPMEGIATIPDALTRFWVSYGHDCEPPPDLRRQCDAAIADAMQEHRRRREAIKLGMNVADYFWRDDGEDD